MKKILDYLEQLGFSRIEAELYLKLFESGPMTVAELSQAVDINRTAAYSYIYSLLEKGVIVESMIGSRKKFVGIDPERLQYLIDQKFKTIKTLNQEFPVVLNAIKSRFCPPEIIPEEPEIKYFRGKSGVRAIYEDSFKAREISSFVYLAEPNIFFPNNIALFNNAFKRNKNLRIREIVDYSPASIKETQFLSLNKGYSYKFMSEDLKLAGEDILIYDGKVAILNIRGKMSSVVIHNDDYYFNSKKLFDYIWKTLPEPDKKETIL